MESISVLDMFKIGVGPSSSHTLGPWKSAIRFPNKLGEKLPLLERREIQLDGSVAKSGRGDVIDMAVEQVLTEADQDTFDVKKIQSTIGRIRKDNNILLNGKREIRFDP